MGLRIFTDKSYKNAVNKEMTRVLDAGQVQKRSTLANPAQWLIDALTGGTSTYSGAAVNSNTAIQVSAVHGCVLEISRGVANMPLHQYKGTTKVQDDITLLLKKPNPYQNGYDFTMMATALMAYRGNFYGWIVRDAAYKATAIHPLPVDNVIPYFVNGQLFYDVTPFNLYNYSLNVPKTIPARDMLHYKRESLTTPLKGESPIAIHANEIGLSLTAVKAQGKAQKDGLLKFLVKSEKNLQPDQAKMAKESLQDIINKDDSIAVLPGGAQVERVQLSPDDLKLLEVMKYNEESIYKIFGVNKSIMDGSAGEEQYIYFYQSCLASYAIPIEQELAAKLLPESNKLTNYFKFNFDSTLRATADKRADVYGKNIMNGVLLQNEAREKENLAPLENGDIHYSPAQWLPAAKMEAWIDAKIENLLNKTAGKNNNPDGNNNDIQA
ncbi:MAG: phage portal protein [Acinetobacter sp.]|uniref:phage portal protein n=1 Tax=Acinetobacter sp. TaxID=472 RepID=UPI000FAD0ACF|nr:phage portal protein [Acinetobacter sp.]RUP37055.1 MAG: phage portal protein [Acinetobacter sp.]